MLLIPVWVVESGEGICASSWMREGSDERDGEDMALKEGGG